MIAIWKKRFCDSFLWCSEFRNEFNIKFVKNDYKTKKFQSDVKQINKEFALNFPRAVFKALTDGNSLISHLKEFVFFPRCFPLK